jgi:hypothetical protein
MRDKSAHDSLLMALFGKKSAASLVVGTILFFLQFSRLSLSKSSKNRQKVPTSSAKLSQDGAESAPCQICFKLFTPCFDTNSAVSVRIVCISIPPAPFGAGVI